MNYQREKQIIKAFMGNIIEQIIKFFKDWIAKVGMMTVIRDIMIIVCVLALLIPFLMGYL